MLVIHAGSPGSLDGAAIRILEAFPGERIFTFSGELGAGKTTFIKAFCRQLGVTDVVNSPSFSIINEYRAMDGKKIYHFDFYRIRRPEEILDIGFDEYTSGEYYCFMEWPELAMQLLPPGHVKIKISRGAGEYERIIECRRFLEGEAHHDGKH